MTNLQDFPEHHEPLYPKDSAHNGPNYNHHHHHHPDMGFMVDRCADRCDDQLPLFSQVGRGLRGDTFLVRIKSDSDRETILEGLTRDEHTGEYHTEWVSENINGGRLSYTYNLRPYGTPNTFTMTFRLQRPNRPEWVWTTPPIPYIWDADDDGVADIDGITGVGVGTLFIKPTGETTWADVRANVAVTNGPNDIPEALAAYEKLLYPEDWTRSELNAPLPGDPYTVNLEYGIGGDINAPNVDDLAKILGVTPAFLCLLVAERDVPETETFGFKPNGDPLNTKEYIDKGDEDTLDEAITHLHNDLYGGTGSNSDWDNIPITLKPLAGDIEGTATVWDWIKYAISQAEGHLHRDLFGGENSTDYADIPITLKPLDGDENNGKTVWDWIKHAISTAVDKALTNLTAGSGIKITKSGSGENKTATISANLAAGGGIQLVNNNGVITILNTAVDGNWSTLTPSTSSAKGVAIPTSPGYVKGDFDWEWHYGWYSMPSQEEPPVHDPNSTTIYPPRIRIIPTRDVNQSIIGAQIKVDSGTGDLVNVGDMINQNNFKFLHSNPLSARPMSAILSIKFNGDYAVLNNKSVKASTPSGSNIWNIAGTDDAIDDGSGSWSNASGASWEVTCSMLPNPGNIQGLSTPNTWVFAAVSIADGYNMQYDSPSYGYDHLVVCPWANWSNVYTLG